MSEKPEKRLVNKREYLGIKCVIGSKTVFGIAIMGSGTICAFASLGSIGFIGCLGGVGDGIGWLFVGVLLGVLAFALIRVGSKIIIDTGQTQPVALLTKHNIGDLPAVETLVRASDLPPSHQQAELLRAAPQGSATPPEEMLRARTNSQGD